jgi:hypothetical protein
VLTAGRPSKLIGKDIAFIVLARRILVKMKHSEEYRASQTLKFLAALFCDTPKQNTTTWVAQELARIRYILSGVLFALRRGASYVKAVRSLRLLLKHKRLPMKKADSARKFTSAVCLARQKLSFII